jgi:hypothetical protein
MYWVRGKKTADCIWLGARCIGVGVFVRGMKSADIVRDLGMDSAGFVRDSENRSLIGDDGRWLLSCIFFVCFSLLSSPPSSDVGNDV